MVVVMNVYDFNEMISKVSPCFTLVRTIHGRVIVLCVQGPMSLCKIIMAFQQVQV